MGLLPGALGLMVGASLKRKNEKINRRNQKIIKRNNEILRGVAECGKCPLEDAFSMNNDGNIIVSGGDTVIRTQIMGSLVNSLLSENEPVIILHESNHELETLLNALCSGTDRLLSVGISNPIYEPFSNLNAAEISKLVIDSASPDYDIKHNAKYYIEAMVLYLECIGYYPSLGLLAKCPHSELTDKTDNLIMNGKISASKGNEIKSKLMMGQSEMFKIETYFNDLKNQFLPIISKKNGSSENINIPKAVKENKIILIDIVSSVNNLLLNVLVNQIKGVLSKGHYINMIIDNISSENDSMLSQLICTHTEKCCLALLSDDLYSACNGDDKMFYTVIGKSAKTAIMNHKTGLSASKWADVFGFYEKTETSYSTSTGRPSGNMLSLFLGPDVNNTVSYSTKRENIIKPEEINRMQSNEMYMYDASVNEILHLYLT